MLGFAPKVGALGDFLSLQDSGSMAGMTADQDSSSGGGTTVGIQFHRIPAREPE